MGSNNMDFNNFGTEPPGSGNFPLMRQSSIYSLTFDELQSTLGGVGKDLGSMNLDELLKSIWSAEETQSMATTATAASNTGGSGQENGGFLQRQGSLTLPRTVSQKKVDDVWKDIAKEFGGGKDGGDGSNVPQRQHTLGGMTLEDFLMRAGAVIEDTPVTKPFEKTNVGGNGIFGDLARPSNNGDSGFGINFQQPGRGIDMIGGHLSESNHQINMQSTNSPLNGNGVRSSQHTTQTQIGQHQQQRQQPLKPKQPVVSYAPVMMLPCNAQLANTGIRGGMAGIGDPGKNNNLIPNSALQGGGMNMITLGGGAIGGPNGSPATLSSDGLTKSNEDNSSVSPMPYMFNEGSRGRRPSNAVEKVVERRQKRMIKNRESAARSRARKQAYTMELEQEVAKLKEENQELRRKQTEIMEMHKTQVQEVKNEQPGSRKRLRRTHTGPW